MKYKLYIRDKEIELSEQELILFTYQKSDATNPTAIKTSYTKTITVPGTPNNNAAFDVIYKLDRYQTSGIFNPSKREPFQLFLDGTLVESGYVKMNKMNISGSYVSYEITLYSNLADLFYGLQMREDGVPLTFSDLDLDICFNINAETVFKAWERLAYGRNAVNRTTDSSAGATSPVPRATRVPGTGSDDSSDDSSTSGNRVVIPGTGRPVGGGGTTTTVPTTYALFDIINFAPAYNGLPENDGFDADKVFVNVDSYMPNSRSNIINRFEDGEPVKSGWSTQIVDGDVTYTPVSASSSERYALVELPDECTEWEMHDLRSYMQRPVVKVKEVIEAIVRYAKDKLGFEITLDSEFFSSSNPYYASSWMSLSLLCEIKPDIKTGDIVASKKGAQTNKIAEYVDIFQNSPTPFDFITSWAKLFNLYFDYSKTEKRASLVMRKNYYTSEIVDIDHRIDRSSIVANPILNYDFKYLDLAYDEGSSEILEDYKTSQTIDYGILRFDTGYDFDSSNKVEPEGMIFKNAADVLEKSSYFRMIESVWSVPSPVGYHPYPFFMNKIGTSYTLFNKTTNLDGLIEYETKSVDIEKYVKSRVDNRHQAVENYYLRKFSFRMKEGEYTNGEYYDSFPKPQFHGDDNGAEDGSNVLLFFNKMVNPQTKYAGGTNGDARSTKVDFLPYFLTDDVIGNSGYAGMRDVLDGSACWLFPKIQTYDANTIGTAENGQYTMFQLPMFNRYRSTENLENSEQTPIYATNINGTYIAGYTTKNTYSYTINYSLDFDTPKQIYVPQYKSDTEGCISKRFKWIGYLEDIYNVNTRVVECYVKLDNIYDALRRFYYFDNSYWIITKISEYTYGNNLVKTTFLKVNDIENYKS